jgi:hypothetical protein
LGNNTLFVPENNNELNSIVAGDYYTKKNRHFDFLQTQQPFFPGGKNSQIHQISNPDKNNLTLLNTLGTI